MSLKEPNIFLIVEFAWPEKITEEIAKASANLHETIEKNDWIHDPVVAYGGIGNSLPCLWIFKLQEYASLDLILHPTKSLENDVGKAYRKFFNAMENVQIKIKHEVQFL